MTGIGIVNAVDIDEGVPNRSVSLWLCADPLEQMR